VERSLLGCGDGQSGAPPPAPGRRGVGVDDGVDGREGRRGGAEVAVDPEDHGDRADGLAVGRRAPRWIATAWKMHTDCIGTKEIRKTRDMATK